ncbi:type II toxin-antitoxin system prevent-host-death family antitoxin [Salinarimonas sp.]|uniref:type II toxin-antitoxin system Phd/YefM family antitoxin n=1 Tax=Salinarimonas sp. TaxID=2766526 RepID=UPI0032D976B7
MKISVTAAKAQLTELVRRAEAGEEVVLTRHGRPAVRLVPDGHRAPPEVAERRAAIRRIAALAATEALPGPDAARSQDYLYDEHGAPR